jgi:5-enolpyruvylshikimate-3-phosphate synthase
MATNLDPGVVEAVALGNLKSVSEQPAMLSNLAYSNTVANSNLAAQNAVANQQALNELGVSILGKMVNVVSNLGPLEAKSAQELLAGNTVGELIADLKAATANFNQAAAKTGAKE